MRRGLPAAAIGAVVALSCAPLFVAAAHAQGSLTVTPSNFALTPAPDPAGNIGTNTLFVDGHFHAEGGFQPRFEWVSVNLAWRGKPPGPQVPGPYTICGTPPSGPPGAACSGADVDLAHHPLVPAPAFNGPYRVNASAHASDQITGQQQDGTTPNIDFNLVAPPPNVTGVVATVDTKTRVVSVKFKPVPPEAAPDLFTYYLWRKGPGDKDFVAVVQTPQQAADFITVQDSGSQYRGGDYLYQVEARRNGATGDQGTYVPSDRTKSQSNKVTVADPPPGQTAPPTTAPKGGAPPPVVHGTPSGVNRSSGFSNSGSSAATTPTSEAVTPDPGFVRGLPYAGSNPEEQNGEGDNSAVAVTPGRHKSGGKGYLVPVAGTAILFLGALHLRLFKKRLDEPLTLN